MQSIERNTEVKKRRARGTKKYEEMTVEELGKAFEQWMKEGQAMANTAAKLTRSSKMFYTLSNILNVSETSSSSSSSSSVSTYNPYVAQPYAAPSYQGAVMHNGETIKDLGTTAVEMINPEDQLSQLQQTINQKLSQRGRKQTVPAIEEEDTY